MCLSKYELLAEDESEKILSYLRLTKYGRLNVDSYKTHCNISMEKFMQYTEEKECYIVFNDAEIPIIKTFYNEIIANIDDVLAVSFDTWILSDDCSIIFEFYHDGLITMVNVN